MSRQRPDLLARRVVRDIMIYTRGLKMRPVPLETVARRLALKDGTATSAALALAETNGWLTVKDGHSLCLTDAGRQFARP
jgi:Mn-dependent DtxR family transcriptional regulator